MAIEDQEGVFDCIDQVGNEFFFLLSKIILKRSFSYAEAHDTFAIFLVMQRVHYNGTRTNMYFSCEQRIGVNLLITCQTMNLSKNDYVTKHIDNDFFTFFNEYGIAGNFARC